RRIAGENAEGGREVEGLGADRVELVGEAVAREEGAEELGGESRQGPGAGRGAQRRQVDRREAARHVQPPVGREAPLDRLAQRRIRRAAARADVAHPRSYSAATLRVPGAATGDTHPRDSTPAAANASIIRSRISSPDADPAHQAKRL